MKRILDLVVSILVLLFAFPLLAGIALVIWVGDWNSPFYVAPRVGRDGKLFQMIKFRSMSVGADKTGVDSTAGSDTRITRVGRVIRKAKVDELPQLFNVLKGEMSLVGPRPNVEREVRMYTSEERQLLAVRPGITDLASIVFSDEGDLLEGSPDPDLLYNQIIRPWKSRLGIHYVTRSSLRIDLKIVLLTVVNSLSRDRALRGVVNILKSSSAEGSLVSVATRVVPPPAIPPPGSTEIVTRRI